MHDHSFLYPWFKLDPLNGFIVLAITVFTVLVLLYSFKFMSARRCLALYYIYIILTAVASVLIVLANNLILLLACWGFLGLTLYLLINMGDQDAPAAAKKMLIIVGGSDALMLLGIGIVYYLCGTFQMDRIAIPLSASYLPGGSHTIYLAVIAYLCIAIACFAKAGAMPFHSWIPDCAKSAPVAVTAYLPAALDKLLGIYLLARISLNLFVMNKAMNNFLMLIGALTIIAGVMMALIQHDLKRLLGYHAVSQVGYMVLGIGTGNPIGIAGGLFHMLNHAIYKSCLFLSGGNVEYRAHTTQLDELGGLAKLMPITFITCMIASFSISGIPPFNGFVSKWLIYQGLVLHVSGAESTLQLVFSAFCLIAAMFGSGLTLASFMKLLHAVFLGQPPSALKNKGIKEVDVAMWFSCAVLAGVCILFGVFAFAIPLKYFIIPAVSISQPLDIANLPGAWPATLATLLLIVGLALGIIIFKANRLKPSLRQDSNFVGGETEKSPGENRVSGQEFYNTIQDLRGLRGIYALAAKGTFDIYAQARRLFCFSRFFQFLHNGVLPTYLVWMLLGMVVLFLVLG
ncbi:MAG: proton-conducting transporter membrane subunit [Candidatus Omnitrophota bacterium]